MDKAIKINVRGTQGVISSHEVQAGKNAALKINVPQSGHFNIELIDENTGYAPQVVMTKRVGNDLVLIFEGENEKDADVILEDYYKNDDLRLIGKAENGQYYEFIPTTGDVADYTPALADGSSSELALGGEGSVVAEPAADSNNFAWLPWLLIGGGAVAAAAIAIAASNKDDNHESGGVTVKINPATDKDKDGRPEISGSSSSPSSKVVITLPDGSKVTTTTDKNGNWSIEAPKSQPNGVISVTVTDSNGNTGTANDNYRDTTAPDAPVVATNNDDRISGTAEPGATVIINNPSTGKSTSTVADSNGKWSIEPNPVKEGDNNVVIIARDPAGNNSSPTVVGRPDTTAPDNITSGIVKGSQNLFDDVAPVTGTIADGATTNDTRPTYSGKATSDIHHVNIYDNGVLVGSAAVDAKGNWSYTPATSLKEGSTHNYTAAAVDKAGNIGPQVSGTKDNGWTFTVDSLAPDNKTSGIVAGSVTLTDDVAPVTGIIADGATTNDTRPTYSGKVTADIDHVNIYDNGKLIGSAAVDKNGNWSFTPAANLAEGSSHEFTVSAVDKAGNEGPQVSGTSDAGWNFTVDTTAPDNSTSGIINGSSELTDDVGPVTGPIADGGLTDDARPTWSGKATPDIDHVNIYDNGKLIGSSAVDKNGNWSFTPDSDLADGEHEFTASAVDKAGNEGPQVSGTDDEGWSFTVDTGAPDNMTSGIVSGSVTLTDDQAPVTGPIADGSTTNDTRPTYAGQATPDIGYVNIYDKGTLIGSSAVDENGRWSFTPEADLEDGSSHEFTVSAVDKAGNEGPQVSGTSDAGWSFTVDTTAPGADVFESGSITLTDAVGPVTGLVEDGSTIDDAQPVYAGKITEAGLAGGVVLVNIYDKGELVGSAAVDKSTGAWSFKPGSALTSGGHGLTVSAVDAAGNEGPQVSGTSDESWDFTLLTSAPAQPSIENVEDNYTQGTDADTGLLQKGQATNDATLTLNGTAGAGMTVQIWATDKDGQRVKVGEGTADENGRWSITTDALGEDGAYDLTATAVNAAGVSSAETGAFPIVLDTVAPAQAVATLNDDQGDKTGVINAGDVTDDRTPTLTGTGEAGATVAVYLDGSTTAAGSVVVDAQGNWTLPLASLEDGEHSYQIKITDSAGNETLSPKVDFTVDASSVALTIDHANDNVGKLTGAVLTGGLTDDSTPELQGTAAAGAVVTIKDATDQVLGSAVANASGEWKFQLESVEDGEHTWKAEVTNEAGNTARAEITLTVDSAAPSVPVIVSMEDDVGTVKDTVTAPGSVTDDPVPTFKGTADAGTVVTIRDGDNVLGSVVADKDGNWVYTPTTNLVEGEHAITATGTDAAGNESARSPEWDFTLDTSTTAPVVTENTTDKISGTAEPGATVTITDPSDGTQTSVVADKNGNWSFEPNPLEVGDSDAVITATDPAGNTNSTTVDGPGDTTPPDNITSGIVSGSITLTDDQAPVTGPIADGSTTNDTRPTYAGQATPDIGYVNIYDRGTLIGSSAVDENGRWSFTPEADLEDGSSHEFTVSAVDKAGNEGPQVSGTSDAGWSFTVDTTAPGADVFESGSITLTDAVGPVTGLVEDGSTIDDAQPVYAGKITEAGLAGGVVLVNIYDKGELVGSAAVDKSTGAWSFKPGSALISGGHGLTVSAVDAAGNEGPQVSGTSDESWDFTLLTSAPAQPSIENVEDNYTQGTDADTGLLQKGQATNDATLTLNGTAGAGMTVQIWATDKDGQRVKVGEGTADENGRWSITTDALGEDGAYDLTATAVNAAGVSSAETGAFPIVLDTVAPAQAVATLNDDQGDKTGVINAGDVTDDRTPTLTGTGEAGATVAVYLDGSTTAAGSVVVDAQGNWTLPLASLEDGEHSYQFKITDSAGNETLSPKVDFTVDASSVALTIDHANDNVGKLTGAVLTGGLTDDSTPELQGTATAGAVVTIKDANDQVLGSAVANASGEWKFQLESVKDGEHTWKAEVTNEAGNTARAEITLTVDSAAPSVPVIVSMEDDVGTVKDTVTAPGSVTDDPVPTFKGTADAGTVVTIRDGDNVLGSVVADKDGNWVYTPTTNLVEGEHAITATGTDAAGNESARSPEWDFTLDTSTTAPVVTENTTDKISGTAEPGATVTITDPSDGTQTSVVADENGNWSFEPNPLEVGDSDAVITATDPAGNTNSTTVDGPGDTTPPDNITSGIVSGSITLTDDQAPVTGPIADGSTTNDTRPTYAGQATPDIGYVNIYDKGTLIGSSAVDENGRWSFTPEADLEDGSSHEFTVSAVDKAGNEGPQVSGTSDAGWSFTVDTTAPGADVFESGSITLTDAVGPVTGLVEDGSTIDDAQPVYAGKITEAGLAGGVVLVNIYDKGELVGSAAVDKSTGAWSFKPGSVLTSGGHGLTVSAVDAAGNEGPQVSGTSDESWDFTLLTSAPAQPSIENVEDNYTQGTDADTGLLQKGQATNDATLTLNGTAGAGMTVQIWATDKDGQRVKVGEGTADENGRWSITTDALGEDGAYDLTATAVNAAGVSSAETGAFPIVLDTVAPAQAVATLNDDQGDKTGVINAGDVTDDRTPTLTGTGEAGATVAVYLDGSTTAAGSVVVDAQGNWTLPLASLEDGEHSYQIKITDSAGNETLSPKVDFTVDASSVVLTIDHANDNVGKLTGAVLTGGLTDDSTPELQGTAAAGAVVTIKDANDQVLGSAVANASGEWKFQLESVEDGEHTWKAEVTNEAGNTARAEITLTVDTTVPVPPVITSLTDAVGTIQYTSQTQGNVTDDPVPSFTGTAEAGAIVTLYDGDAVLGSVIANDAGEWSFRPTTNLREGTHSITATATDAAGNTSEPSDNWNFVLDVTAPGVGISGNSAESLSGVSEPGAIITVTDDKGTEYTAVADQAGRWIIAPNPIEPGVSGTIYVTDPAGNKGESVSFQGAALGSYDLLNESAQVNTSVAGDQANPTTTRLADGRIVVSWQGAGVSATEVYMQMYEADGVHKIGTEQQVNQRTNGNQDSPQVVALADGGFIIVYESYNGGFSGGDCVVARRYGADGQAVTDEFMVNVTTTGGNQNHPSVMATPDGGYIITWQDQNKNIVQRTYGADNEPATGEVVVATGTGMGGAGGPEMATFTDEAHSGMYITVWNATSGPSDKDSTGVVGQIFGADGKPLGSTFQVNTTMDAQQNYPDVITLKDGSFVVYWDTNDSGAIGSDVRAIHYTVDPATGAVSVKGTGDFIVNTFTVGKQYKPVGVALEDGGYLIIWGSDGGDGHGSAIYAQRYDASDNKVGREFIVNTTTQGNQGYGGDSADVTHILDATLTADGNVYITWQSDNVDGSGMGVEGIVVSPDAAYYSEFTVNTAIAGDQTHSSVAALPGGGSIVVWQSTSGDGSGTCIKGQMLDAKGQPVGGEFMVNATTAGDQLTPQVTVLPNGDFEVVWSSGTYIKGQKFTYTHDGNEQISGVVASGSEININSGTGADNQTSPTITTLADGGYMVVWQGTANGVWEILGRQYDASGAPVGDQKVLATTTLGAPWALGAGDWQPLPTVTTLADGKLAIAYTNKGTGYDSTVLLYDPATQTTGAPVVVNQTLTNDQASPVVTALGNGNFIVTWDSNNNGGPDQQGFSVWGRIYDANGAALGDEFMINTATAGDQHLPVVVSRDDGSFVVVFVSATDSAPGAGTYGIYAQYFDAQGNKIGQQMQINQLTYGNQIEVDAAFLEGGQLYVTWTDQGVADGAGSAIKGRIVDLVETLGLEQETANNDDPTTIDYQPSTETATDSLPPNVGISVNNADKLGGQTEPGAKVTVVDANNVSHVAVADSKGAWSLEPNPLAVGEKGYISASDAAGNAGAPILIRGTALDGYDLMNESMQVNTTTANEQSNPTVTRLEDGRIVVIWQSNDGTNLSPNYNVYMQLYDADGVHKIGTEQQINQRTANHQDSPQVVALADGGFLVVYESWQSTLDPDGDSVLARRYGSDGQALTDEFLVNTTKTGNQNNPSAMATPDGGYVITWQDQNKNIVQRTYGADNEPETGEVVVATGTGMGGAGGPEMATFTDAAHSGMYITVWNATSGPSDKNSTGVVGQIFGADGQPLGGAFQVNTTMDAQQNYPDVITLKDGSFVVYWDTNDSGAIGSDVRAVHYTVDPATGAVSVKGTGDFIVNTYTDGKQYKPVGVALEDGGYLIIWGSEGGDGHGSAIYAQRYDASDNKVGREFIVNTTTQGNQGYGGDSADVTHIVDATLMADGNVYISWQSDNVDGSNMGIEGIVVNPDAAYYSEFTVNSTKAGDQSSPVVVSLPDGGLFEVWVSANGDGSGTGIRGQMLDAKGQPVGGEFTVNTTTAGDQLMPVVLENGNIQVVWTSPASGNVNYIKGQQYTYAYDSEGNVSGLTAVGSEFNISSGAGATYQGSPQVTSLSDGGYLVVWEAIESSEYKIYGRQYNADGSPATGEMTLSSTGLTTGALGNSNYWSALPSVSELSNGKVAISFATKGSGYDSSVVLYDPATHTAGASTVVNQTTAGDQASASVSALDNGNFVVTWDSNNNSGPDQTGFGVWGRIYDANGQAISNEFLINTVTAGDQHLAKVVSRADGSFVAVFVSATDTAPGAGTNGIYAQYFDAHGNKVGQQMQINQLTYGEQIEVNATFMAGGQLYVTWTDQGVGDGSGSAIKGRIVDLNETLGLKDDGNGLTHIDYQPAQFYVNGTDGNDALDARGAITVDAKDGNDTIFINSTNFTSINGGEGHDTLVWDSYNNLELGSVSSKISGIEVIHMGNNSAQTLVISASDVLDMTKDNGETGHVLYITGDDGDSNKSGARDSVSIDKSVWTAGASQTENGVTYDVYVHNDDTTVKLLIQHGMNVM
jgi:uncharacterized protein (DUF2249 family)